MQQLKFAISNQLVNTSDNYNIFTQYTKRQNKLSKKQKSIYILYCVTLHP